MTSVAEYLHPRLVGKTIVSVRSLTDEEIKQMMWFEVPEETVLITLSDGTQIMPMRDPEGNGSGFLEVYRDQ
jgi:hypothetical protein